MAVADGLQALLAFSITASIFSRLRMMPASFISRVTSRAVKAATLSRS